MSHEDTTAVPQGPNAEPGPLVSPARLRLASVATAIAALAFFGLAVRRALSVWSPWVAGNLQLRVAPILPLLILGWAVLAAHTPKLRAQLLCRAAWWSSLIVGVLVSLNYGAPLDKSFGAVAAVGCAVALLSTGGRGLDIQEPDHPFAPVRFREHLLLALVMAAADALTLTFSGLMQLRFGAAGWNLAGTVSYAGPTVAAALVMALAVWGVYRLRTWALLLNLIANIAIAYLALEGALRLSPTVSVSLAATAAVQCFIPVPILASALGDRHAGQPFMAPVRRWLIRGSVVLLAGYAIQSVATPTGDGWVDGPGRAFVRGRDDKKRQSPQDLPIPLRDTGPRVRLGATDQDLRGRSFDGEPMAGADFHRTDLREASFVDAGLRAANFSAAQLDGADFRGALLYDASFGGGSMDGADFTGARLGPMTLYGVPETVTCPNGQPSSPTAGCGGKLGYETSFERKRLTVVVATEKDGCPPVGHVSVTGVGRDPEYLRVLGRPYVRLARGGYQSTFGKLSTDAERWILNAPACGRIEFEVEAKPIPRYVEGQFEAADYPARLQSQNFENLVFSHVEFGSTFLAGSRFNGAEFRESGALFAGAELRKTEFTGALTTAENWQGVDPASLKRVTCPDRREPDPKSGCVERRGTYDGPLPGPLLSRPAHCGEHGAFAMDGEFLAYDGVPFVLLHQGGFVSPDPSYRLERAFDGTWELSAEGCRMVWAASRDDDAR